MAFQAADLANEFQRWQGFSQIREIDGSSLHKALSSFPPLIRKHVRHVGDQIDLANKW